MTSIRMQPQRPGARPSAQFVALERRDDVLRARFVCPTIGQREAPIILDEVSAAVVAAAPATKALLIDLTEVQVMSGLGLGMCTDLAGRARRRKMRTVIRGSSELVDLLQSLRLDTGCTMVRDEDELERAIAA
jgi:anti-anti-sigma regulatory factor